MNFDAPDLSAGMADGLRQTAVTDLAKAQNLAWEECVSDARRLFFENGDFAGRGALWRDLTDRQSEYIELYVNTDELPHTFERRFTPPSLGPLDEDQVIVRMEKLATALDNSIYTFDEIVSAHETRDLTTLDAFTRDWNQVRDARPAFATFLREVQLELTSSTWAELLRDRLGLAHYQPVGEPLRVALMAYKVREVVAEAGTAVPFTTPTVLDATLWEHYFPAPREIPFGRAMALTPCDSDDRLVAEILHSRLTYRGEHIRMIGTIQSLLPVLPVAELRSQHLLALQVASGREDFGK